MITEVDQTRLAQMRSDSEQWCAMFPHASYWDVAFLLRIIDELKKEPTK